MPCASLTTQRSSMIRWSTESCSRAGSRRWTSNCSRPPPQLPASGTCWCGCTPCRASWSDELIHDWHGVTPLELLDQVGLLNERLLIPHATYTDRNPAVHGEDRGDLARLADSGASIIHCPLTSMRYGSTLDSFDAYKAAGINISLGTDSFPPDLIRGIDAGVQLAKILAGTNDAGDVAGYFDAATLGGAHALRRPDLGRLEPGAQADLVAFSLGDFRDGVHDDPLRTLLLNGTARQAVLSVVAGTDHHGRRCDRRRGPGLLARQGAGTLRQDAQRLHRPGRPEPSGG